MRAVIFLSVALGASGDVRQLVPADAVGQVTVGSSAAAGTEKPGTTQERNGVAGVRDAMAMVKRRVSLLRDRLKAAYHPEKGCIPCTNHVSPLMRSQNETCLGLSLAELESSYCPGTDASFKKLERFSKATRETTNARRQWFNKFRQDGEGYCKAQCCAAGKPYDDVHCCPVTVPQDAEAAHAQAVDTTAGEAHQGFILSSSEVAPVQSRA